MKRASAVALVALGLAACRPGPVKPPDTTPLPSASSVLEDLRARAGTRTSLRTLGRVTYFGDRGRVRLKAVLLARRPGAFRVETLSPFEQPVDVMASDGEDLWLLSKDQLRFGAATPQNIARLLPLVMGPEAVVDTLLGGVPDAATTRAEGIVRGEDGLYEVTVISGRGDRGLLWVDPVKRRVERMSLLGVDGQPRVTVRFSDFEAIPSGGELPRDIEVKLAEQGSEVTIKLGEPDVNVALPDALFRIEAPPGVTPLPLDAG